MPIIGNIISVIVNRLTGLLPSCVSDIAVAWYKNLIVSGDTCYDVIGKREDTIFFGQYLSSGTIDFGRSGTFDYIDPSTGNSVTGVAMSDSYAVPANGICEITTSDGSFYPCCERAGTVLHDVKENSVHILVTTPVWAETLYGTDFLNQYGYTDKTYSDALSYPWTTTVDGSAVALDDDTLVPAALWEWANLLDANGNNVLDTNGDQVQSKNNI